ncbi:hypothetical protein O3M35_002100 [Rhynocoris fuscipes]|uniref:Abasic site processing protein HMCES n=1 Tax=Rhynocoris fuscipes TaxID=488301 RepID=A0AAW1CXX8_9HEMI
MCGRTSCHCRPATYQKACSYYDENFDRFIRPKYDQPPGHEFFPSTNIAPTQCTPVLISGDHFSDDETTARIMRPMIWGMIPPWHQGDYKTNRLSTNNCRIENILNSKLYSTSLKKGYRCIVICDGFYEWQTTKGKNKQPYFIYNLQSNGLRPEILDNWNDNNWSESKGWSGPLPLLMAGLFNLWQSNENEIKYSYSVITMESTDVLSWCHHRMPAILTNDEQIRNWLDYKNVTFNDALEYLTPVKTLAYHPVSNNVNNSRNKDSTCNKPIIKKESKSSLFMQSWLKTVKDEPAENKHFDDTEPLLKKIKKEE